MAKSKLTDDVQTTIVKAIEAGCYAKIAAEAAGIDESTFYRWMRDGELAQSGKMREFYQSVTRAQGVGEVSAVTKIAEAAKAGDWKAAAWMLERRFSSRWANTQRIEIMVQQELEAMLGILEGGLEPDEFRKVAGVIAAADSRAQA